MHFTQATAEVTFNPKGITSIERSTDRERRSTFYDDVTAVLRQCEPYVTEPSPYVTELVPDPEFDRLNLPQLHRNLPR